MMFLIFLGNIFFSFYRLKYLNFDNQQESENEDSLLNEDICTVSAVF